MYKIDVVVNSTPDQHGFLDFVTVRENGIIINSSIGSGCPNPCTPNGRKRWYDRYGWIAPGIYPCETINHPIRGRCVVINGGKAIPSRNENPNHSGKKIITQTLVHGGGKGKVKKWRGSAGCITISPYYWETFQKKLPDGTGVIEIIDASGVEYHV